MRIANNFPEIIILICLILFLYVSSSVHAQGIDPIVAEKFMDFSLDTDSLELKARLFVPELYDPQEVYPLVMTLHSSGETGTDNYRQLWYATHWGEAALQVKNPCFIFSPQSPGAWTLRNTYESVMYLLDSIIEIYTVDTTRIYVTGASLGGIGTWHYLEYDPDKYAAALPLCGAYQGSNEETVELIQKISHIPVWNFHGTKDNMVEVGAARRIMDKYPLVGEYPLYTHRHYRNDYSLNGLQLVNYIFDHAEVLYSEVPDIGHNIWDVAYTMPQVKDWLFRQRRHATDNITIHREQIRHRVSQVVEITFTASELTDRLSIWSGHINSPDWQFLDEIDVASGSYRFDSEQLDDHPFALLKFIAHDSNGHAIGKDYSDTLTIDNAGNGRPHIELIDDYFLKKGTAYEDSYSPSILLGDPESQELHLTITKSYDNGESFYKISEHDVKQNGVLEMEIDFKHFQPSPETLIKFDVSDGISSSSVSTFKFRNENIMSFFKPGDNDLQIHPNPVQSTLNITTKEAGMHRVKLMSLSGELLYNGWFKDSENKLDLSFLKKGCYLLIIQGAESKSVNKIIKL